SGYGFESHHRHLRKGDFYEGNRQICDLRGCERSRIKTHEMAIYLPSIRQMIGHFGDDPQ
ncbi:MAG TPA: hypothetical protein VFA61_05310, partial [Candidatus Udaeobacter sp.]|nr:hypothetical protein [Candidatus Udaeobacter sp.]